MNQQHHHPYKASVVAILKGHGQIGEEDEEEMYDSDNMPADLFKETERERKVREGYLAREMWKGYKEWLGRRPQELERFEQFMVRNFSLLSCSFDAVPITNHIF